MNYYSIPYYKGDIIEADIEYFEYKIKSLHFGKNDLELRLRYIVIKLVFLDIIKKHCIK